ncbi:hypothetical protein B4U79_02983 [Dinothrombium tinctorium]|uniref:Gamma-glutamyltranspeptidase 1-like protein n=1 Tax=Dinothrombium tinctorium TaxID=1965070 RepID=A0A3S3NZH8_9ACAR|nr:hypothetical protein B4U79_02983 [Dinothrombium tinctorium]
MGVVEPESMGLGGGCFITYYDAASKKAVVFDGRETAPMNAHVDMFKGNASMSRRGPLSIAIPGELKAYWEAHRRYGRLPWNNLFDSAIEIAEKGFAVSEHLAFTLKQSEQTVKTSQLKGIFINPLTKETYKENEFLKRVDLASTLKRLSVSSPDLFYAGEMGTHLVQELRNNGAVITLEDFKSYNVSIYDAFSTKLDNISVYTTKPPGSGVLFAFILKTMHQLKKLYQNAKHNFKESVLFYHLLIEVFKHSYSRRALLGDPKFDDISEVMRNLTSSKYAEYIASLIHKNRTFSSSYYGNVFVKEDHGTAHVSVIDQYGNAASVGSTINSYFGSSIFSPSTGIIFNNEMDDFSSPHITNDYGVPPTMFNNIAPGKRPFSSMCPSILVDEQSSKPILVIGGSGGTQITTADSIVALRHLIFQDSVKTAIDGPRIHHQLQPNYVSFEENFPQDILSELENIGHKTHLLDGRGSVVVAVAANKDRLITANSDFRKGGSIDGI